MAQLERSLVMSVRALTVPPALRNPEEKPRTLPHKPVNKSDSPDASFAVQCVV